MSYTYLNLIEGVMVMINSLIEQHRIDAVMSLYGKHLFRFDEESGNVLDSVGNAVGAVASNVTRVNGWNNIGKAVRFNRNRDSFIQFNSRIIPNGSYTIRFKLKLIDKPTSENQEIISQSYYTADHAGLRIWVDINGKLTFTATRKSSGNYDFTIITDGKFDGEWHDYMMAWDTVNKRVYLYEDGELIGNTSSVTSNTLIATYNLTLGKQPNTSEGRYFYGELDDLQIYSKYMTYDELEFIKVMVKVSDNEYISYDKNASQVVTLSEPSIEDWLDQGMSSLDKDSLYGLAMNDVMGNISIRKF